MRKLGLLLLFLTLALNGCSTKNEDAKNADSGTVILKIWAGNAAPSEHWRTDAALEAAKLLNKQLKAEGKTLQVKIKATNDPASWGNFRKKFILAAESGAGPDIICTGHEDIANWSQTGLIVPIAQTVQEIKNRHKAFSDVEEALWPSAQYKGKIWAIPQDREARLLFFYKPLLKKLGWSGQKIQDLPKEINSGNFTLDDMIQLARQAIDKKVIKPGNGYWHRPTKGGDHLLRYWAFGGKITQPSSGKIQIDKQALHKWYRFQRKIVEQGITPKNYIGTEWSIFHSTVTGGKVLFWEGGTWHWAQWANDYAKALGGYDYLRKNIGYALPPTAERGRPPLTMSHPLVYLVTAQRVSGQKQQELAIRLLALMTTKELNTRHAVESSHLGILKSQMNYPPYEKHRFLHNVSAMLGKIHYVPNHSDFSPWFEAVWHGMVAAQNGKDIAKTVDQVVQMIKVDVGENNLVIQK